MRTNSLPKIQSIYKPINSKNNDDPMNGGLPIYHSQANRLITNSRLPIKRLNNNSNNTYNTDNIVIQEFEEYVQKIARKKKDLKSSMLKNINNNNTMKSTNINSETLGIQQQQLELIIKKEIDRHKPRKIKNDIKFEGKLEIFKPLDTYIETKNYFQKLNIINNNFYKHKRSNTNVDLLMFNDHNDIEKNQLGDVNNIAIDKRRSSLERAKLYLQKKKLSMNKFSKAQNNPIFLGINEMIKLMHKIEAFDNQFDDANEFFSDLEKKFINEDFIKFVQNNPNDLLISREGIETDIYNDKRTLPKGYIKTYRDNAEKITAILKKFTHELLKKTKNDLSSHHHTVSLNCLNQKIAIQDNIFNEIKSSNRSSQFKASSFSKIDDQDEFVDEMKISSLKNSPNNKGSGKFFKKFEETKNNGCLSMPTITEKNYEDYFLKSRLSMNLQPGLLEEKSISPIPIPNKNSTEFEVSNIYKQTLNGSAFELLLTECISEPKSDKDDNDGKVSPFLPKSFPNLINNKTKKFEDKISLNNKLLAYHSYNTCSFDPFKTQGISPNDNEVKLNYLHNRVDNNNCVSLIKNINKTKNDIKELKRTFLNDIDHLEEKYEKELNKIIPSKKLESTKLDIDKNFIFRRNGRFASFGSSNYIKKLNKKKICVYMTNN